MTRPPIGPQPPPGPAELYAALSQHRPLDWGADPPARDRLEDEHGTRATNVCLSMIAAAALVEPAITKILLTAMADNCRLHQLDHRVKSPQSLARKLSDRIDRGQSDRANDVLRFTVLTESPADLVTATRATVDQLAEHGWRVAAASHSYLDGSRYKGIHADLVDRDGQRIEIQFHSRPSASVKAATCGLYAIERDAGTPDRDRERARAECIRLSAELDDPPGIDALTELGGVPVRRLRTGDSRKPRRPVLSGNTQPTARPQPGRPEMTQPQIRKEGFAR